MTDDISQMKIHEAIRLDLSPVICHRHRRRSGCSVSVGHGHHSDLVVQRTQYVMAVLYIKKTDTEFASDTAHDNSAILLSYL